MPVTIHSRWLIARVSLAFSVLSACTGMFPPTLFAADVIDASVVRTSILRLDADRKTEREEAEHELLRFGPKVLPMLPDPETLPSPAASEALRRVRVKLERQKAEESVEATRLRVADSVSVAELLKRLNSDTGNSVVVEGLSEDLLAKSVELPKTPSFWTAIDALAKQRSLSWQCEGSPARLRLSLNPPTHPAPTFGRGGNLVTESNAFRIALRSAMPRDVVGQEARQLMRLELDVTAEPRLRPLFLSCAFADLRATGIRRVKATGIRRVKGESAAREETWPPFSPDAKLELTFGQGRRQTTFPVDFRLPTGGGWSALCLSGKLQIETAAAEEPIDFPVGMDSRGVPRRRGGVTVRVVQWETDANSNERDLTVRATVGYDTGGPAFDSHRSWMLSNIAGLIRVALNKDELPGDAELLKPSHHEIDLQPDGKIVVIYRFEKLPHPAAEYRFRYVAPTLILNVPVEFELRDVPLTK